MAKLSGAKAVNEIKKLIDDIDNVRQKPRMSAKFKLWQRDAQDALSSIFGKGSKQVREFDAIRYNLAAFSNQTEESEFEEAFHQGLKNAAITLAAALKELEKNPNPRASQPKQAVAPVAAAPVKPVSAGSHSSQSPLKTAAVPVANINRSSNKLFLLYAFDNKLQTEVSSFLSKLRLTSVVVLDKPTQQGQLAEKLKVYNDVGYALFFINSSSSGMSPEMIFDLGAVVGRLGSDRVCGIVKSNMTDLPGYSGIAYVPYDAAGAWKFVLIKQLKSAGFEVDANLAL